MRPEQRCDENRIEISRPVEIVGSDDSLINSGYTQNISDGGARMRLDQTPVIGDLLQLQIALAEEAMPHETVGKVIWCASDVYGDGAEVGLRFYDSMDQAHAANSEAPDTFEVPETTGMLAPGRLVTVEADGHILEAVVDEVFEDEGASIRVSLSIIKPINEEATDDDLMADAEEWKSHPFRDAKEKVCKYGGPALSVIKAVAAVVGGLIAAVSAKGWKKLPLKIRRHPEALVIKLAPQKRIAWIKAKSVLVVDFVKQRVTEHNRAKESK